MRPEEQVFEIGRTRQQQIPFRDDNKKGKCVIGEVWARRSSCWRWLMSWPAMVSTMVQKVMVPRSGWVVRRRRSSWETLVRKSRFQLRAAWKRASAAERS